MGYGGMRRGHHVGVRRHVGVRHHRPFRHRRRARIRFGFGVRRRHYYGVHHVHHTRAYYVGAGTQGAEQTPPPAPPYTVLYETQSQFQKIKIVEFTNQVRATNVNANQPKMLQQGSAVLGNNTNTMDRKSSKEAFINNNNNNNINGNNDLPSYDPPPYNPNANTGIQVEGTQSQVQQPGWQTIGNNNTTEQKTKDVQLTAANTQPQQQQKQQTIQVQTQSLTRCRGLVLENEIQFSELDEQHYHSVLVHSAMDVLISLQKTNQLRILIIGGGDCACIRELVKYDQNVITEITMIEIDQMVVDTCKQWFPAMTAGLQDRRVNVIYNDANLWVKQQQNNNNLNNYDLIICDLTEDGTISAPLINQDFWNNLVTLIKQNINGTPDGIIIRNGYHKPNIYVNNNTNNIVLNNQYYISTHLPTFGGQYCFTILSHNPIYGNLTDFVNVDPLIRNNNNGININTKVAMATPEELEYSYNYYYYNPEPEEPWYQQYGGWIILAIIVLIIIIIVMA